MGVEEFFQTLIIILMVTTFFTLALIFLYLLSREENK
jgi:preprotein translocase subunit SecG